ncbi:MAG TPA: hypothetical protein VKB51_00070 [bacterium]|nr:hypothetical protein [bacterium]
MKLWLRIALYVGGGGLIITWINPPAGLIQYALIGLLIVGAAYLDAWLFRPDSARSKPNVVSLASLRRSRNRQQHGGGLGRERRVLQTVYSSAYQGEVDELLGLLRSEGLNPMMVSQSARRGEAGHVYEVRLPDKEVPKARPLIQFFLLKSAKTPS